MSFMNIYNYFTGAESPLKPVRKKLKDLLFEVIPEEDSKDLSSKFDMIPDDMLRYYYVLQIKPYLETNDKKQEGVEQMNKLLEEKFSVKLSVKQLAELEKIVLELKKLLEE